LIGNGGIGVSFENNLLNALSAADQDLIRPLGKEVELATGAIIYSPGDQVDSVYFPCGPAMAGFFIGLPDGKNVETALVGREGAVGGIVSQGRLPAYSECSVLNGGHFLKVKSTDLENAKNKSLTIRHLFARYADCVMAQIFQTTACNAGHTINQRAAKWMISTAERSGENAIQMSQVQLGEMLGIGRSYISRVISWMKAEKIISVSRKKIILSNMDKLRSYACDCNDHVKRHFDDVLKGVYPDEI
jgi:hypothetical protein